MKQTVKTLQRYDSPLSHHSSDVDGDSILMQVPDEQDKNPANQIKKVRIRDQSIKTFKLNGDRANTLPTLQDDYYQDT